MGLMRVLRDPSYHDLLDESAECCPKNLSGDAARNFETSQSRISFYRVENEVDNLRVAVAIAATRKHLDDVHFCVVPDELLAVADIGIEETNGETLYPNVNSRHVDLKDVNLAKLSTLITFCAARGEAQTLRRTEVRDALMQDVRDGTLGVENLRNDVFAEIKKAIERQEMMERRQAEKAARDAVRATSPQSE